MFPVPSSDSHRALALPLSTYFKFNNVPVWSMVPLKVMWLPSGSPPARTTFEPLTVTWRVPSDKQCELTLEVPTRDPPGAERITTVIVNGEKLGCRDWKVPDHVPVTSRPGCCEKLPVDMTLLGWSDALTPYTDSVPTSDISRKRSEERKRNRKATLVIVILRLQ